MLALLLLAFTFAGTAAQAERLAFDCDFVTRCSEEGCLSEAYSYQYRLDTTAGTGEMIGDGYTYAGSYLGSDEMHHFVFVNSTGIETTSITLGGDAIYSGQMTFEGMPTWYRLEGHCVSRAK